MTLKERKPIPIGTKSGSWTCIGPAFKDVQKYGPQLRIPVKCDCGKKYHIMKHSFKYIGKNKQCTSCGRVSSSNKHRTGFGQVSGKQVSSIRLGASRRGISYNVTAEQLWNKYIEQDGKCALSGIDLILKYDNRLSENTASLDRIDSSKGYTVDNIQWVHKTVNIIKWDLDQKEFIDLCIKVADKNATFVGG